MDVTLSSDKKVSRGEKIFLGILHIAVLAGATIMTVWITRLTLTNMSFLVDSRYLKFQFWMCLLFLTDIIAEWILSAHKFKYICTHVLFLLISIPYLNIINHFGLKLPGEVIYLLHFMPLLRGCYVFALVSGALTSSHVLSMFWVYFVWISASLLVASLMFYVVEHNVNPAVDSFWTSVWWSALNMTTTGTNINAVTATGKVIAVTLSAEGMTLFPVFTVYITSAVIKRNKKAGSNRNNATPADSK